MSAVVVPIVPAIQLKRILYATDLSATSLAVLPVVAAMARKYGSQLYVAHVWSPASYSIVPPTVASDLWTKQESDAKQALDTILEAKEFSGICVTPLLQPGEPLSELTRIVQQNRINLAVLSTHGRTGLNRLVMGSVAEELFRGLPCPVLTVGPNMSKRSEPQLTAIRQIVFPTDLSRESQAVVPYLAIVAAEYKSRVMLLYVVPGEDDRHPSALDEAGFLRAEIERAFCPHFDPRCELKVVIEAGDPTQRILACAAACNADLIGFGVRKAKEISTHLRNTVTYKVVLQAECPVLTAHFGDGYWEKEWL